MQVVRIYLESRAAALKRTLDGVLDRGFLDESGRGSSEENPPAFPQGAPGGAGGPDAIALRTVCSRAVERYVPQLCESVEGLRRLEVGIPAEDLSSRKAVREQYESFVKSRVGELCAGVSGVLEDFCPAAGVLVPRVHSLWEALQRPSNTDDEGKTLASLLQEQFREFLLKTALKAASVAFRKAR